MTKSMIESVIVKIYSNIPRSSITMAKKRENILTEGYPLFLGQHVHPQRDFV